MNKYNNTKFLKQFNAIFNKIPHIYSEIFLKIFGEKYSYFVMFDNDNFSFSFIKILKNIFCNIDKIDDQNFFNKCVFSDLDGEFNDKIEDNIKKSIVSILSSDIEIKVLLDMIDNNDNNYYNLEIDNYDDELPITFKGKTLLNAFIETSGKVGNNKIQIQAQLSDEEKDNAFYLVINDKVLDLKALIQPEAK